MSGETSGLLFFFGGIAVCVAILVSYRLLESSEMMIKYRAWVSAKWWRVFTPYVVIGVILTPILFMV